MAGAWGSFALMVVGRGIFGMGSETMFVLKATYTALWFHDQEISFAMGVNSSIPYFFSFISGYTYPAIAASDDGPSMGVGIANAVGCTMCMVSFLLGTVLVLIDSQMRRHD